MVATVTDFYADRAADKVVLKVKVSLFDETDPGMNVLMHKDMHQRPE